MANDEMPNLVRIDVRENENPGGIRTGCETRVFTGEGAEITHITAIDISIRPNEVLTATLEVWVDAISEFEAHPLLGLETVRAAAARHGYDLVAQDSEAGDRVGRNLAPGLADHVRALTRAALHDPRRRS